jgi:DNA-binding MarR family transcriptional regulator
MSGTRAELVTSSARADELVSRAGDETATKRIRELLNRRELAATRHRRAIRRSLALDEAEMLALSNLALHGHLTPTQLRHALGYSTGGVDAVLRRLERDGHATRHRHPTDGRSRLVRPAPELVEAASAAFAPLVTAIDELTARRSAAERRIIETFLAELVQTTEEHARRLLDAPTAIDRAAVRVPALWA